MSNAYEKLRHDKPITLNEIKKLYDGYWIYVVKAKLSDGGTLISGIPVIKGLSAFAGAESGVYDDFRGEEYEERTDLYLLHNDGFIASFCPIGDGRVE